MRLLPVLLVASVALSQVPVAPANADDLSWVDLRADSISILFPGPDVIEITAHYSIVNNMATDEVITSDIAFALDGVVVGVQAIDVTRSLNECRVFLTWSDCKGECYLNLLPPTEIGECQWYFSVIPDSVTPEGCFCTKKGTLSSPFAFSGQSIASFVLDGDNLLPEPIETNNSQSLNLGVVTTRPTTWGRMKTLYR